ncbi:MAG: alpha/beta hydrolase [Gemmataceae bacterium]
MQRRIFRVSFMLLMGSFGFVVLSLGCGGTSAQPKRGLGSQEDISYLGNAATTAYAKEQCRLDVYYPTDKKNFATVVWFHGGGLKSGKRRGVIAKGFADRFTSEGHAVVLVSYRFSPKVKHPVYIEDAAAAVAWTIKNIGKMGGDPKKVFVSGHSAGGYLTAMVGLDEKYLAKHKLSTKDIAGLMPVAGQMVTHSTVRAERGIPKTRPIIDEFAPCYHVRQDAPPCICFAGDNDLPARMEENLYFVAAMKAAKHQHVRCLVVAGRNHGTIASKIPEEDDEVARAMLKFMKQIGG